MTMLHLLSNILLLCVCANSIKEPRLVSLAQRLEQLELELMPLKADVEDYMDEMDEMVSSTPAGDLPVTRDWFKLPAFDCGDGTFQEGGLNIYFPQALDSTYPIVSFLHGSGGGRFDDLCSSIASLGIVVVAPGKHDCGDWSNQQAYAVTGSEQNKDAHRALAHVDFTRVGVIGHSEGSAYTLGTAAYHRNLPIKAAVASHGGGPGASVNLPKDLPVYFATGTKDPRRHRLWPAFDQTPARPAIWSNVAGATHMAPANSGPQNAYMAHFLGCYLLPRKESCDMVFGDQPGSLCHGGPNMAQCIIRLPQDRAPAPPAPMFLEGPGQFDVAQDYYTLSGFDCGNGNFGEGGIAIYYPANPEDRPDMTYPIVSFLHGSGGGQFGGLCSNIASLGIVVVFVHQGTCGDWSDQQMYAVTGSQQNQNLHKVLPYVDFTSIGVIGHSEGGAYTMKSATKAGQFPIKAAVASHGVSQPAAPKIPADLPMFYVSGTSDKKQHKVWWAYQATKAVPRIFASIRGGGHMWPLYGSPMNEMMAHFLACYLLPRKESCEIIFGDGPDSLCKKNPMGTCVITKEESSSFAPAPVYAAAGDFGVAQDSYVLSGFDCGDGSVGDGGIVIYFPAHPDTRPDMTYPIASFLHGSGGGRFDGLCREIASLGIVVVAVQRGTCGEWSVQQMHAVTGSQQNQNLHKILPYVDFTSIGVIGHSEGGAYTMESATKAKQFPIKAAVASHGVSQPCAPNIPANLPMFYVSGTADKRQHKVYWAFQATTSTPRIFASILGGGHMYPAHGSPMNGMMAHFLACYLLPRKESCDIIFGDSPDSLCKANPMGDCEVIKDTSLLGQHKDHVIADRYRIQA